MAGARRKACAWPRLVLPHTDQTPGSLDWETSWGTSHLPLQAAQKLGSGVWKRQSPGGVGRGSEGSWEQSWGCGLQNASSPVDEGLVLAAVILNLEHPHGVCWPSRPPAHQP